MHSKPLDQLWTGNAWLRALGSHGVGVDTPGALVRAIEDGLGTQVQQQVIEEDSDCGQANV